MKKNLSVYRHLAKTVSWRIIGTIDTIVLGWLVTGNFKIGLSIGGFELITKMVLYFLHERIWYKIPFGVKKEEKTWALSGFFVFIELWSGLSLLKL